VLEIPVRIQHHILLLLAVVVVVEMTAVVVALVDILRALLLLLLALCIQSRSVAVALVFLDQFRETVGQIHPFLVRV
jgi:hypothetical protein